jgi:hypothetical protein
MLLRELILPETPVNSSWISDLTLVKGRSGDVTMALGNGRRYSIKNVGKNMYAKWIVASSKGQFWHQNIKNNFQIVRLL